MTLIPKNEDQNARAGVRREGLGETGNAQKKMSFFPLDVFLDAVGADPKVKQTKVVFHSQPRTGLKKNSKKGASLHAIWMIWNGYQCYTNIKVGQMDAVHWI